jgi:CHAT domain-containing protein/Flp pilus assembly protein TadD
MLGPQHPQTLITINNIGLLYQAQGRYGEAEQLFKRALSRQEQKLGTGHPDTLTSAHNLALIYLEQGRYGAAESLLKSTLSIEERVLSWNHPNRLITLNTLAGLYREQGRFVEAEPILKYVLSETERTLGAEHPDALTSANNLAELYIAEGRFGEAEPLLKRTLSASEHKLGAEHPETLVRVDNLGGLYFDEGRYSEAEPLVKRAMSARERLLGADHPDSLLSANNLAVLYMNRGVYAEAEPLLKRALSRSAELFGPLHPASIRSANNLAFLHFEQGDWTGAAEFWLRSSAAIIQRTTLGISDSGRAPAGNKKGDSQRLSFQFVELIKALYRLPSDAKTPTEAFETAQWALSSEAAHSLAQMAARGAKGNAGLAALVRKRQDLAWEWQKRDSLRNATLGQVPSKRNTQADAENSDKLAAVDARMSAIDEELTVNFPDYSLLSSPAPISVSEVQKLLTVDEALVLTLDTREWKPTPEETFIWVVTKSNLRWVRSDLGTSALAREVQALRCGLDAAAWDGSRCAELTGQRYTEADRDAGEPLPFDHARAYSLYQALFGQVEDLIKGKELLIVSSGPLTQLPFQVLVTKPPADSNNKSAAWLIRDHALTVLPAVSSLKALRRVAHPSVAPRSMIGFGNPLLDGPSQAYSSLAKLARENKTCSAISKTQVASAEATRGVPQMQTRGGLADAAFLRKLPPLPETADELCAVARDVGANTGDIYLGARATESEVKRLSETGQLATYRILHFATHGALAGQLKDISEPGLILTPPLMPSEEDDGYLTASEIAGLKLDADWIILSACNTAAGGASGAEALSGLARAFFYAQARALLVSHWEVNSDTTVKLITGAISRLASDKTMGRAEALRQSLLALIDKEAPQEAHPAFWAPFVVVGENEALN